MKKFLFFSLTLLTLGLASCDKDENNTDNEEELITTLVYTLTPNSGQEVVMSFKDLDGDGGSAPLVTTFGNLIAGQTYNGSLSILNESTTPIDNITTEIEEEALAHQFFFNVSGDLASKLNITYDDKDSENNPIGLKTKVNATSTGTGKLKVTLRHEPNKKASGVATGNIANAAGETDIEVEFNVEVK